MNAFASREVAPLSPSRSIHTRVSCMLSMNSESISSPGTEAVSSSYVNLENRAENNVFEWTSASRNSLSGRGPQRVRLQIIQSRAMPSSSISTGRTSTMVAKRSMNNTNDRSGTPHTRRSNMSGALSSARPLGRPIILARESEQNLKSNGARERMRKYDMSETVRSSGAFTILEVDQ